MGIRELGTRGVKQFEELDYMGETEETSSSKHSWTDAYKNSYTMELCMGLDLIKYSIERRLEHVPILLT